MKREEIKRVLDDLTADIDSLVDPRAVSTTRALINLIEILAAENAQIQDLRDEINRLKGEKGKPDIRGQHKGDDKSNQDHSSEAERKMHNREKTRKPKNRKSQTVKIDRTVVVGLDKAGLPKDAVFKGYETRIVQDLKLPTDNIAFKLATYYSASQKKTFIASLPKGYEGEFGPGIKALVLMLYRDSGMTEPAILRFLGTCGIDIAASTISRMITEGHENFHQEKEDIISAGLHATAYQHVDDTGCRVNGKNFYTHILCNPFFTGYFTYSKKDRLTVLELLCRGEELKFLPNQSAYGLMAGLGLQHKWLDQFKPMIGDSAISKSEMDVLLKQFFPNPKKHRQSRRIILEACAIVYYQQSRHAIEYLMCDDAPQFKHIAMHRALCWVHEGRHFKKLIPISKINRRAVETFVGQFWDYYRELLAYKAAPTKTFASQLNKRFEQLFSTKTGYEALDSRIAKTYAKKKHLLLVLDHPFLPLHNNPAELGARVQARIRDINLHTVSANGTRTKDTFATISQTARKLGVNLYQYLYDRISKKLEMPSLAELIATKTCQAFNTS